MNIYITYFSCDCGKCLVGSVSANIWRVWLSGWKSLRQEHKTTAYVTSTLRRRVWWTNTCPQPAFSFISQSWMLSPIQGGVFQHRWPNLTKLYQTCPELRLLGDCRSCQPENNEPTHTVNNLKLEDGLQNSRDPWQSFCFSMSQMYW